MNLQSLIQGAPVEKTASAQAPAQTRAESAVQAALDAVKTEKTASVSASPVTGLRKIATEIAGQDQQKLASLADSIGRLMARGYVDELSLYEKAASEVMQKQASQMDADDIALAKFAKEQPEQFLQYVQKLAAQRSGGADVAQVEKAAAEDLEQRIFKSACDHYMAGYEVGKLMGTPA